jgi:hypothetical protein
MTVRGVADHVIAGGRVVLDDGELRVSQGAGRFVSTPPYSPHIYLRVQEREKVQSSSLLAIFRCQYMGVCQRRRRDMFSRNSSSKLKSNEFKRRMFFRLNSCFCSDILF